MENFTNLGMTEIAIVAIMAFHLAWGQNPKPYIRRKILLLKS